MTASPSAPQPRVLVLGAALLGACSPPALALPDATPADGAAPDTAPDTPPPELALPDAAPDATAAPCALAVDLQGAPREPDGTVRVRGNNRDGAREMYGDLGRLSAGGCLASRDGRKGRVLLWRYTLSQRAVLRVSTANPGTADPRFDTVLAVLPNCALTARPLACNDDAQAPAPHALHSTASTGVLAAGTVVYLALGGHATAGNDGPVGDFELTVTELPPGARGSVCRVGDAGSPCDPGLECSVRAPTDAAAGACLAVAAAGDACDAEDVRCASATACVGATPGAPPRCLPDGADGGLCRLTGAPCDPGLACTLRAPTVAWRGACRIAVRAGEPCDLSLASDACEAGSTCVPTVPDPRRGACVPLGTRGGNCRAAMPLCAAGLTCSNGQPTGLCRATVTMEGAACDPEGRSNTCAAGLSCVLEGTDGRCRRNGTTAATACRDPAMDGGMRCDAGLVCTAESGPGTCLRDLGSGEACDPSGRATRCPRSELCVGATALAGTCRAFPEPVQRVAEIEPNDSPAQAQGPVTRSAVFQGSVEPGGRDCFAVIVPARGSLSLDTELPRAPGCTTGDPVLTFYNPDGALLSRNDDREAGSLCARISALSTPAARDLPAGTYVVCISGFAGMAVPDYDLTALLLAP